MGGVKVKALGCAVIVGDVLIKVLWEGFCGVTACGLQTNSSVTQTHTGWLVRLCVCLSVCVRVTVCSHVSTWGDRQLKSAGTVVTSLFEIVQNRFFSIASLSSNSFFSTMYFPALPHFQSKPQHALSISWWWTASHFKLGKHFSEVCCVIYKPTDFKTQHPSFEFTTAWCS